MSGTDNKAEHYEYPPSEKVTIYLLIPGMWLFSLIVGIFALSESSNFFGVICILSSALFIFANVIVSFMYSPITIVDEGIGVRNFGRILKFIRWEDVTKVKKVRQWNAASRSYDDIFHVFDGDFSARRERMVNLRGPIVFSDKIGGLRALLDKINSYARRYSFPLIVLDQEAARTRAAHQGAGAWERTVPKADETNVTAF